MEAEEERALLCLIVQHLKDRGFLKAAKKLEKHLSQVEQLQYSLRDVYVGWMRMCRTAADSEKKEELKQGGVTNGEETPSLCGDLDPAPAAFTVQPEPGPTNNIVQTDEEVLDHRPESVVVTSTSESEQEVTSQAEPVLQPPEDHSSEPGDSAQEGPSEPPCMAELQEEEPQREPAEPEAPPPADPDLTPEVQDHQDAAEDQMMNSEASVEDQATVEDAATAEELGVLPPPEAGDGTAAEEDTPEEVAELPEDLQVLKKKKKKKRKSRMESESLSTDAAAAPESLDSSMEKKTGEDEELTDETLISPSKKKGKKRKKEQEEETISLCVAKEREDEEEVEELVSREKKKKKRRRGGKKEVQCEEQPADGDRDLEAKCPDETLRRSRKKPRLRRKMSLKKRMMLKKDLSSRKRKVHLKEIQLVTEEPQRKKKKKKVERAEMEAGEEGLTLLVISSAKRKKKKRPAPEREELSLSQ
ncbi:ABC transporter F family member 4-like isoform X2 [Synchiropus splendidus]|uniref:ABC transporter F family member 4-like isoform X2 n=1 Tax=Synchiropus splendidus TaxID=270530 RepID=UPI00237D3653|nr:ABC transporter F family member 4-like isoform X2 [Synchiropus splendidus]